MDHIALEAIFKAASASLDHKLLQQKSAIIETGIWLDSVVLRISKEHWANDVFQKPQTGAAIFFSIWLNEKSLKKDKVNYNIHAFKLRDLKGYSLTSSAFTSAFRKQFNYFKEDWPNLSTEQGPRTLMQGWITHDPINLQRDISELACKFFKIDGIIDELLTERKKHLK